MNNLTKATDHAQNPDPCKENSGQIEVEAAEKSKSAIQCPALCDGDSDESKSQTQKKVKTIISETLTQVKEQVKEIVSPELSESEQKGKRKKTRHPLSMNLLFAIIILVEILLIAGSSSGILELVRGTLDEESRLPDLFWLSCVCLIVGIATTVFLIRFFSVPIFTLGNAINKVAEGDFSAKLKTDAGFLEMRKINSNFNTMVKELSANKVLQSDFVSNVSHEFKTPISAIEGYATLLSGIEPSSPEQAEYVEKILFNTQRLSTLVSNILLLSKVDNQSIPDKKSCFRLDEQIRQSILALESAWTEKDCELDVELEEINVFANEPLLYHVWTNLISNAIKFGPRFGKITITLHRENGIIVFNVSDEGEGVSDEAKKHIFERFYQSDSSHKSEGNGIGLALVKQILRLEGGEISVSDNEPQGASFTVRLTPTAIE